MCPPPKPKKPKTPNEPLDPPVIELGATNKPTDIRARSARGRSQLRTGLSIPGGTGSGLSIPD